MTSDKVQLIEDMNNPRIATGGSSGIAIGHGCKQAAINARGMCHHCTLVDYEHANAIRMFAVWSAIHNERPELLTHTRDNRAFFESCWGFQALNGNAGYLRRCDTCQNTPLYPWAKQLDPEQIAIFLDVDSRFHGSSFAVSLLRVTLSVPADPPKPENPYNYPVMPNIEHGQTASFSPVLANAPIEVNPDLVAAGIRKISNVTNTHAPRDYDALRRELVGELPKLDDGRGFKLL